MSDEEQLVPWSERDIDDNETDVYWRDSHLSFLYQPVRWGHRAVRVTDPEEIARYRASHPPRTASTPLERSLAGWARILRDEKGRDPSTPPRDHGDGSP